MDDAQPVSLTGVMAETTKFAAIDTPESPVRIFVRKFVLLLYKQWRITVHRKILTAMMILLPCVFVFIPAVYNVKTMLPHRCDSDNTAYFPDLWRYLLVGFLLLIVNIAREINQEKESRLKEAMRMMGVSSLLQWLSWWEKYLNISFVIAVVITLLLKNPFTTPDRRLARDTDFLIILLLFVLWCAANISLACFISTLFNTASTAAVATAVIYILTWFPYLAKNERVANETAVENDRVLTGWICMLPNTAVQVALDAIKYAELNGVADQSGRGIKLTGFVNYPLYNSTNLNCEVVLSIKQNISVGEICLILMAHIVLMTVLTWYTESVFPGRYGVAEKPWFFLTRAYWCGPTYHASKAQEIHEAYQAKYLSNPNNEKDPLGLKPGIYICGLTKEFGPMLAVDQLYLKMFEGQITAFLGHNGAGKTTTMSMLTGFISPTNGTAIVNGHDIRKDLSGVRASLGLCPQHNILFDNLTVEEHLYFLGMLKGCPSSSIRSEIDYYVKATDLEEKRHKLSKTLSGGQKRKLSVCIALISGSKVVILDEPTTGMDPSVRRQIWDLLQSQQTGRTILLSTHFMDEADHLGDRIAIVAEGELQCCGSSLFLKRLFGHGYTLIMNIDPSHADLSEIEVLIKSHVKDAVSRGKNGAELSYTLPAECISYFPALFTELESQQDRLGVLGFGASVSTMEDVFRRVGANKLRRMSGECIETTMERPYSRPPAKNEGFPLFAQQLRSQLSKRKLYSYRSKGLTVFQIMLPLAFTILLCFFVKRVYPKEVPWRLAPYLAFYFVKGFCCGFVFLSSSFILYVTEERASKSKHSQISSGLGWYTYWLANLIWDYLIYTVVAVCIVIIILSFNVPFISSLSINTMIVEGIAPAVFLFLLLTYGLAVISFTYLLQFLIDSRSLGFILLCFYHLATSVLLPTILDNIKKEEIKEAFEGNLTQTFPSFAFALAVKNVFIKSSFPCQVLDNKGPSGPGRGPWSVKLTDYCSSGYLSVSGQGPIIGRQILSFLVQTTICWILITIIESGVMMKLCYKCRPKRYVKSHKLELGLQDTDVAEERRKIVQNLERKGSTAPVVVSGLSRYFGSFAAVDQLYVQINANECFGLLGVNGAGKTTTFRMLTGDEIISGGTAYLEGSDIRNDINGVHRYIGYCPQFDALPDHMTGEETLYMYAAIRGVTKKWTGTTVGYLIEALDLTAHRHKLTRDYSGGNKRKLGIALALTGDPPIIFLDEPTSGMDPAARRRVWDVISVYREQGNTIVLTTHSMEEGEALCTRMAIMVNGKFRCLGSAQHLKNKFGDGYTIIVRIADPPIVKDTKEADDPKGDEIPQDGVIGRLDELKRYVGTQFQGCRIVDEHLNVIQYHIPKGQHGCGSIFKIMESAKKKYNIEDYSVSQTSIEQVFLNLAREQRDDRKEKRANPISNMIRKFCGICLCCVPEYIETE